METQPALVQPESPPVFPIKPWLAWFLLLLLPPVLMLTIFIVLEIGLFEYFYRFPGLNYSLAALVALVAGSFQWLYLRRKITRPNAWFLVQLLVYELVIVGLTFLVTNQLYLIARNFSAWERIVSFSLILLIYLLPGALLYFFYFRSRKVQVSCSWFRDYALMFVFGIIGFLIYDFLTVEKASPFNIPHEQFITNLMAINIFICAGVAWVMARVPFPGVDQDSVKAGLILDYLQGGWFKRFQYWLIPLLGPGVLFLISYFLLLVNPLPSVLNFLLIFLFSGLFYSVVWFLFKTITSVSKWGFFLSSILIAAPFLIPMFPEYYDDDIMRILPFAMLTLLMAGLVQLVQFRKENLKVSWLFIFSLLSAVIISCTVGFLGSTSILNTFLNNIIFASLIFPTIFSVFQALFFHPGVFLIKTDEIPLDKKG